MGLDMYAYTATKADPDCDTEREIAYWRKHPNLHGWMERLYRDKGGTGTFNGVELELTWDDLDDLEKTIKEHKLPPTQGFFFGDNADEHYYNNDLEFVKNARAEIFSGLKVFYNSSW